MLTAFKFILSSTLLLVISLLAQASQTPLCEDGLCDIEIQYTNGGSITSGGVFLSFGENASLFLGETGSYDLGVGGYFTGINEIEFSIETPVSNEAVIYLGEGARLDFSEGGFLQLGMGGNITPSDYVDTKINYASYFTTGIESTAIVKASLSGTIQNLTISAVNHSQALGNAVATLDSEKLKNPHPLVLINANEIYLKGRHSHGVLLDTIIQGDVLVNAQSIVTAPLLYSENPYKDDYLECEDNEGQTADRYYVGLIVIPEDNIMCWGFFSGVEAAGSPMQGTALKLELDSSSQTAIEPISVSAETGTEVSLDNTQGIIIATQTDIIDGEIIVTPITLDDSFIEQTNENIIKDNGSLTTASTNESETGRESTGPLSPWLSLLLIQILVIRKRK